MGYGRKRITAMLLVLVMAFGAASLALADEPQFMGAEWGEGFEDACEAMGFDWTTDNLNAQKKNRYVIDLIGAYEGTPPRSEHEMSFRMQTWTPGLTIAGHEVEQAHAYFVYTPNENGKIAQRQKDSAFVVGGYKFRTDDGKSFDFVLSDLNKKLPELYGEVTQTCIREANGSKLAYYVRETENTYVVLQTWEPTSGSSDTVYKVFVWYGWKGGDKLLRDADLILSGIDPSEETEPPEGIEGNYEGL